LLLSLQELYSISEEFLFRLRLKLLLLDYASRKSPLEGCGGVVVIHGCGGTASLLLFRRP
jgi:hypothetical protein